MSKAGRTSTGGYTYVSLLVVIVAATLSAQTTWVPSGTRAQRAAEAELIFRGLAYRDAIRSYWEADPDRPSFPSTLEDLLQDPRGEGTRHIRRLYEPVFGDEWELLPADGGGIAGVAPRTDLTPLKRANFPADLAIEDGADSFGDWRFVFTPEPPEAPK